MRRARECVRQEVAMKGLIAFVVSIVVSIAAPLRADEIDVTGGYLDVSTAAAMANSSSSANAGSPSGRTSPTTLASSGRATATGVGRSARQARSSTSRQRGQAVTSPASQRSIGITYPKVGGGFSDDMTVLFSGSAVLPALGTASTTVSVPFLLSGRFSHTGGNETLHGIGTATLFLSPPPKSPAPGTWTAWCIGLPRCCRLHGTRQTLAPSAYPDSRAMWTVRSTSKAVAPTSGERPMRFGSSTSRSPATPTSSRASLMKRPRIPSPRPASCFGSRSIRRRCRSSSTGSQAASSNSWRDSAPATSHVHHRRVE